jgi:hypothetical protein
MAPGLFLEQVFARVGDVVVRKARHEVVAVVVARLLPQGDAFVARLLCSLDEVFWQKLALFVEVVLGALSS